jgi:hypothetical protein
MSRPRFLLALCASVLLSAALGALFVVLVLAV